MPEDATLVEVRHAHSDQDLADFSDVPTRNVPEGLSISRASLEPSILCCCK